MSAGTGNVGLQTSRADLYAAAEIFGSIIKAGRCEQGRSQDGSNRLEECAAVAASIQQHKVRVSAASIEPGHPAVRILLGRPHTDLYPVWLFRERASDTV